MKMAEVEVGQEYAYQRAEWDSVQRVLVLKVRQYRHVYSSSGFGRWQQSANPDGVLVIRLDRDTGEPWLVRGGYDAGKVDISHKQARTLRHTWAEQAALDERARKDRNMAEAARAVLEDQVALANEKMGGEFLKVYRMRSGALEVMTTGNGHALLQHVLSS